MPWSFAVLLVCQAVGEGVRGAAGLPVPGTVFGIAVLLAVLACMGRERAAVLLPAGDALLPYLSLLFVPPGVAGLQQLIRLPHVWPLLPSLVLSSVAALVVTGRVAQWLMGLQARRLVRAAPGCA